MIDRDRNTLYEGDVVEDAAGLLWLVRNDTFALEQTRAKTPPAQYALGRRRDKRPVAPHEAGREDLDQ
jgi:hypothetical protein